MGFLKRVARKIKAKRTGKKVAGRKPRRGKRGPLGLGRRKKPSRAAGVRRKKVTGKSPRKWKMGRKPSVGKKLGMKRPKNTGTRGKLKRVGRKLKKLGSKLKRAFGGRKSRPRKITGRRPKRPRKIGGKSRYLTNPKMSGRRKTKRTGRMK